MSRYHAPEGDKAAVGCWRVMSPAGEVCRHSKRSQARACAAERNEHDGPYGTGIYCTGEGVVKPPPTTAEPVQLPLPDSEEVAELRQQVERLQAERASLIEKLNRAEGEVAQVASERQAEVGKLRAELQKQAGRVEEAMALLASANDLHAADVDALATADVRVEGLLGIIREMGGEIAVLRAGVANDNRAAG